MVPTRHQDNPFIVVLITQLFEYVSLTTMHIQPNTSGGFVPSL